ncbi:hypothetical protein D9M68_477050 [compost metagenome]
MNWGTRLVIGSAAFMLFIAGMAFYMFSVQDRDALVEDDYYEKGMAYNDEMKALQRTQDDHAAPQIKISESQLILQLNDSASYSLKLLKPSSAKEDRNLKGTTAGEANLIVIDRTQMSKGLWMLELRWVSRQKEYRYQKNISL